MTMDFFPTKQQIRDEKRRQAAAAYDAQRMAEQQQAIAAYEEHRSRYSDVADALDRLGINPVELRDYLAGPLGRP